MKELQHNPTVYESPATAEKEFKFRGSLRLERGHSLWELNLTDKSIGRAVMEAVPTTVIYTSKDNIPKMQKKHLRVVVNKNCIYTGALNLKSAIRKFALMIREAQTKVPKP